jgi:type III pantothenate kinase
MSSPASSLNYAVDIGNSGLRILQLPAQGSPATLAEPLRINWYLGDESTEAVTKRFGDSVSSTRFRPASSDWTSQLQPWVTSVAATHWWVSSVCRPAMEVLLNFLADYPAARSHVIGYRDLPMRVAVDEPGRVGIDRLLAAYAACHFIHSNSAIVIQAGSAVTVDLVQRQVDDVQTDNVGTFLGGAILPGVPMMLRLLGRAADMLPEIDAAELIKLPALPGKNTEAAMLAGTSSCMVGGVQHLVARYRQQYGTEIPILISGGDGPLLLPFLNPPVQQIPQLVLEGIRKIVNRMQRP